MSSKPATIDAYIATFPEPVRPILHAVRQTIRAAAPEATEGMSYGIATYRLNGKALVYFAGWKEHVSVYPLPPAPTLDRELQPYRHGAGTARFALDEPIPHALITRIVAALRKERGGKA